MRVGSDTARVDGRSHAATSFCAPALATVNSAPMADLLPNEEPGAETCFGGYLRYYPRNPGSPGRDRFILPKGHGVPVQYTALSCEGERRATGPR